MRSKQIDKAFKEIKKSMKGTEIKSFQSTIPLTTTFMLPSNPKVSKKPNHLVLKRKNRKLIEIYGNSWHAAGRIYDENFTKKEYDKVINILAKHDIFTFHSFKAHHHEFQYLMLVSSFLLMFLGSLLILFEGPVGARAIGFLAGVLATILMFLYIK